MSYFWSEGSALVQLRTGSPDDPATVSARMYLIELRDAFQASAASLTADLNGR